MWLMSYDSYKTLFLRIARFYGSFDFVLLLGRCASAFVPSTLCCLKRRKEVAKHLQHLPVMLSSYTPVLLQPESLGFVVTVLVDQALALVDGDLDGGLEGIRRVCFECVDEVFPFLFQMNSTALFPLWKLGFHESPFCFELSFFFSSPDPFLSLAHVQFLHIPADFVFELHIPFGNVLDEFGLFGLRMMVVVDLHDFGREA